jgi:hypothetical protein
MQPSAPKVSPIFSFHQIQGLEENHIAALYEQRYCERQILQYSPESSAPQELKDAFCAARVKVNLLENKIRRLRHGF